MEHILQLAGKLFAILFVVGLAYTVLGCSSATGLIERHQISTTVIYADVEAINVAARGRGYLGGAVVKGFYDPVRNEIWCPDSETTDALRTCGHELRHLIKGNFH